MNTRGINIFSGVLIKMKKIVSILLAVWMFVLFLNYSGFFRDDTDPVGVTEFYFRCMGAGDWTLTYQVTDPKSFDHQELLDLRNNLFFKEQLCSYKTELKTLEEKKAVTETQLFFESGKTIKCTTVLEKLGTDVWYIRETRYDEGKMAVKK